VELMLPGSLPGAATPDLESNLMWLSG